MRERVEKKKKKKLSRKLLAFHLLNFIVHLGQSLLPAPQKEMAIRAMV